MASKYWIKLYHEILDDPKMGIMPDHLWRRTIELFLIAGEYDQDGVLPSIQQISWKLRVSIDECNETLQMLQQCNIIVTNESGDFIIKSFSKRQGPSPESERTRRHRERAAAKKAISEPKIKDEPKTTTPKDVTNRYDCNAPDIQITDTDINISSKDDNKIPEQPTLVTAEPNKPPAPGKKGKPPKTKKPRVPPSPAFKVYSEVTGNYAVPTYWRNKMASDVGEAPEDLELWEQVVIGYSGKWYSGNVEGMLDYFNRREIPGKSSEYRNGGKNGQYNQTGTNRRQQSPKGHPGSTPGREGNAETPGMSPERSAKLERLTYKPPTPTPG